ncbi:M24 family metallopeptidase [Paraferrimonas sp. SM1919]|uniref:M24 family metallopeptidase n=1 Tax=Paraferrimonas sp. SM1919 TaxID=2662263 RepID=UPI0013D830E8|nr:M24 family metallopeptidase [Paraferrimonas sp. SM1919]
MTELDVQLLAAQQQADQLFKLFESQILKVGKSAEQLTQELLNLAQNQFDFQGTWHPNMVRVGKNTLCTFVDTPEYAEVQADDIVFVDLGPIFAHIEADFARTYVLGSNADKLKIQGDANQAWQMAKSYFDNNDDITGEQLFNYVRQLACDFGWQHTNPIAGHILSVIPDKSSKQLFSENEFTDICIMPGNHKPLKSQLKSQLKNGQTKHWILEIHFVCPQRQIGAFVEELLTI